MTDWMIRCIIRLLNIRVFRLISLCCFFFLALFQLSLCNLQGPQQWEQMLQKLNFVPHERSLRFLRFFLVVSSVLLEFNQFFGQRELDCLEFYRLDRSFDLNVRHRFFLILSKNTLKKYCFGLFWTIGKDMCFGSGILDKWLLKVLFICSNCDFRFLSFFPHVYSDFFKGLNVGKLFFSISERICFCKLAILFSILVL